MELILMLTAPLALGLLVRQRVVAYLAYIALHAFVFTFQSLALTMEWINGSTAAFGRFPAYGGLWSYGVVNLLIYAAGLGLLTFALRAAERRRGRVAAVSLDAV